MSTLLDKFSAAKKVRDSVDLSEANPLGTVIDHLYSATEASINGRRTILAGTNNYLGLTFHNDCINAAQKAIQSHGTGTTGSRMANGSYASHGDLERNLADFYGTQHALIFSTGYMANLGMIASLVGPGDRVLLDQHCHASIYDGCKLSGAEIIHFRHNDAADLDKRLRRLGSDAENALIISEGIYSMLGDRARLNDIVEVKEKYGCMILLDEAHSLGVLGETGRGLAQETGTEEQIDFITGTFSKSLSGIGGYCVSNHEELSLVRFLSRPYIFTASPSPATVATTHVALNLIRQHPELRARLWENANILYTGLEAMGFELGPEVSPVISIAAGSKENTIAMWKKLLDRGIYVNLVLPPATPDGKCLLRCSVSAAHSRAEIDVILGAFSYFQQPDTESPLAAQTA